MVLSRAIDNAIGTWRKDNPKNIAVLSSGVVLAHNESADITKEVMALVEKKIWFLISYPKWKCTIRMKRNQNKVSNH